MFDIPNPGDYNFLIFLDHPVERSIITPKGMTLKLAGWPSVAPEFALSHWSYLDSGLGGWPDGSAFIPPAGYYQSLFSDDRIGVSLTETESLYKTIRFLDEEDESRFVKGAVADGRSRVIVELHGLQTGADVALAAGDGSWVSNPTVLNGVWRRTWQAPESYGGSPDGTPAGRRPIGFAVVMDGKSVTPPPFNLYKAPVVMLHGLWGKPNDWDSLATALQNDGFPPTPPLQYPYQASFADNAQVTSNHVAVALARLRGQGLVAKKADIVAHSMGGCLAKRYGSREYIRRIVTVGTPHYGSPVANRALECDQFWSGTLEWLANTLGGRSLYGAVQDLRTNATGVPGDALGVPVLALNGIVQPNDSFPVYSDANGYIILLRAILGQLLAPQSQLDIDLFGFDTSDWVVSGLSQRGGLPAGSVTNVNVTWHVDEPKNPVVISKTIAFLDDPNVGAMELLTAQAEPSTEPLAVPDQSFVLPISREVLKDGGIAITAPTAGTVYLPGATMRVTVSAAGPATTVLVALSDGPVVMDSTPPFETDITIPQDALGPMTIGVLAWDTNGVIGTASTAVNVTYPFSCHRAQDLA